MKAFFSACIYRISQNPATKDYFMVFEDEYYELYCEKCEEEYTNKDYRWCKPCLINDCEKNFTKWTSENEKINNFIQEMQLKIDSYSNIIFEWIPYNQFNIIKE